MRFSGRILGVTTMAHASCKRIWEGTLGIAISPRKKRDGEYFWSFSFVRAFRRTRDSNWEYVQHFGQQHATALGTLDEQGVSLHAADRSRQVPRTRDGGGDRQGAAKRRTRPSQRFRALSFRRPSGRQPSCRSFLHNSARVVATRYRFRSTPSSAAAGPVVHELQVKDLFPTPLIP